MRSQKLFDNMKNIIRHKQVNREIQFESDQLCGQPDKVKFGEAAPSSIPAQSLRDILRSQQPGEITHGNEEVYSKRARTETVQDEVPWEDGEKPELTKPNKGTDLEPWSEDFFGLLQAADYLD